MCQLSKLFWPDVHPDELISPFVIYTKIYITKVSGVSFEIPKDYILQNLKMMPLTIRSWKCQLSHKWQEYFLMLKAFVSYYFYVSPK